MLLLTSGSRDEQYHSFGLTDFTQAWTTKSILDIGSGMEENLSHTLTGEEASITFQREATIVY